MTTGDKRIPTFDAGRKRDGKYFNNLRDSINLGRDNNALKSQQRKNYEAFNESYDMLGGPGATNPTRANFQTYPYDYFCGTNAKVFFGDVWVDDIINIQYNVSQGKEPVYGYASQTFDAVARGTLLVQGTFSIAFKEMGYLNVVQRLLEVQRQKASAAIEGVRGASNVGSAKIQKKVNEDAANAAGAKAAINPRLAGASFNGLRFSPTGEAEIIRSQETIEEILTYKKTGNVVASGLTGALISPGGRERDFEDFAELLEDSIWGDSNGKPYAPVFKYRRPDEFDYTWTSTGADAGGIRMAHGDDYSKVLNIMLTFGDINDFRAEHTLVVLNDVHILSTAMIVSPTGEPIAETYTFFARDINQNIAQEVIKNINPIKFEIGVPYELSKISDIDAIEKQLSREETPRGITIYAISTFSESTGWIPQTPTNVPLAATLQSFELNKWEPLSDQVSKTVERLINDPAYSKAGTDYSQYVVKVNVGVSPDGAQLPPMTMVLEQKIPNTLTFRVISPTRTNYLAPSVFTREDLWKDAKPAKVRTDEPIPKTKPDNTQNVELRPKDLAFDPITGDVNPTPDYYAVKEVVDPDTGKIITIHAPSEIRIYSLDDRAKQQDLIDSQNQLLDAYDNASERSRERFARKQADIDAEIAKLEAEVQEHDRRATLEEEYKAGKNLVYDAKRVYALYEAENEKKRIEELKGEITKTGTKDQVVLEEIERLKKQKIELDKKAREEAAKAKDAAKQVPPTFNPGAVDPAIFESEKGTVTPEMREYIRRREEAAKADAAKSTPTKIVLPELRIVSDAALQQKRDKQAYIEGERPKSKPQIESVEEEFKNKLKEQDQGPTLPATQDLIQQLGDGRLKELSTYGLNTSSVASTTARPTDISTGAVSEPLRTKPKEQTTSTYQKIQEFEGYKPSAYVDTTERGDKVGTAIGYGFNISPTNAAAEPTVQRALNVRSEEAKQLVERWRAGQPIEERQAEDIFRYQYVDAAARAKRAVPQLFNVDDRIRASLTDLFFNVGEDRALQFSRALKGANEGDIASIIKSLSESKRARQVPTRTSYFVGQLEQALADKAAAEARKRP